MTNKEIESKCRELRELQALINEATAEAETIKDSLKAIMGVREELRAGEYKITYKTIESSRIDTTALKKALPEVVQKFTKKSTTRRFTVA